MIDNIDRQVNNIYCDINNIEQYSAMTPLIGRLQFASPHSFSGARASVTRFLGSTIYLGQQAIPFLLDRIGQDF
jgi:hypothetical protein